MAEPVNVLITLQFPETLLARLRSVSPRVNITQVKARKAEEVPAEVWARTEVLYTSRVLPTPEQAPELKWIQFHWAGIDHAVDAPILGKEGLVVTTLSGANATEMAEFVLAMLLGLGHCLPDIMGYQKRGEWPKERLERFQPKELRGSQVGIIGYGSVGRQVACLLQPFGATVLATKRDAMHPQDTGYAPEGCGDPEGVLVHRLYPGQALRSMLRECDFVVVTVPLTPETRNLVGAEEFAAMKPGSFLVDVSRGGVVNHTALLQALKDKKIDGAALDVYPEEPLPADSPLWKLNNVILSPHIAGSTPHYDERAVALFAENLQRYLAGLPLYNTFDPHRGY